MSLFETWPFAQRHLRCLPLLPGHEQWSLAMHVALGVYRAVCALRCSSSIMCC
jgi:hypothetical protein